MRRRLLPILAAAVPLGIGSKLYAGPGEAWVRGHAGGVLYVVFWCLLVLWIRPQLPPWRVGAAVLAATVAVEISQLWHPPFLEAVRSTSVGHALIGSTFGCWDLPHYAAGMLLAVAIARWAARPGRHPDGEGGV